jgi:putative spermidine/putrescine transport system permease protein
MGRAGVSALGWGVLAALAIVPLVALTTQAVASFWFFPDLIPREWTLEAVRRIGADSATRRAFVDGLVVSCGATVASVALAIPAARALALGRLRHARLMGLGFLVPTVIPPVALAMGLNVALLRADLTGTRVAVVMAHLVATLPYAVLILTAALTRYDLAYERQAALLGASARRILTRVFLPLATPAIMVAAALSFTVSWSQYLLTLLPGGGQVTTLPVLLLAASGGGNPTTTAALALATAAPPALAILLVVRRLDTLGTATERKR